MHRRQARTRPMLAVALALALTLGACELADSPDTDPSPAQQSDDGVESAAEQTPAEVATDEPTADPADGEDGDTAGDGEDGEEGDTAGDDDVADEDGEDAADEDGDVIEVEMTEFAYEPSTIQLTAGEPTVMRFTNVGEIEHEAMIGTAHMQQEFAAADDHGDHGDGGHHGDVMAVTVPPGETAELEVLIDEPGTWYVGCHLEGHYDAGMEAVINVTR